MNKPAALKKRPAPRKAASLVAVTRALCAKVEALHFAAPVAHVYNPLSYAAKPHEAYLRRYGQGKKRFVLLGMNPGPYGMAQTGVPFGEVALTRDFLKITGKVEKPKQEHPKRPILGFDCKRSEVSGSRLWGFVQARYGQAEAFFEAAFVLNYCPLVFMDQGGRNLTPDKLPAAERAPLFAACDEALGLALSLLEPEIVIGVGAFGEACARRVIDDAIAEGVIESGRAPRVGRVLHPSPASPAANRGWAEAAAAQLEALGLEIPKPATRT